jgi:hypothetical protein
VFKFRKQLQTCNQVIRMDCATVFNSFPTCIRETCCKCFQDLFKKPLHYDPSDIIQYTSFNYSELKKYLNEINKHLRKDILLNRQDFINVPAIEVKRANDHLIDTLNKVQLLMSKTKKKGHLHFYYCSNLITCDDLVDLFMKIANTQDTSIQLLNKPMNPVGIKYLADILQQHRICLYVYYQYYNVFNFGRTIKTQLFEDSQDLQIYGFHFKK